MIKFDCESCGKIDEAEFDGYSFAECLLEDVTFIVSKNDDGTCNVRSKAEWDKDPYLYRLNKEVLLKEAAEFAKTNDIFACPICGDDVIPDDMLEEVEGYGR